MNETPLHTLAAFGQSAWLDYISRPLLETGKLKGLVEQGLMGMTSNPSLFNQSISATNDYDEKIVQLKEQGKTTFEIYDALTIRDIQEACDILKPVYEKTNGVDGYVSLEINPQLANTVKEQAREGMRLYSVVKRPNVMIKVPSTPEGLPVVEELIGQGINVNVTLIFSQKQYEETAKAYLRGLTRLSKTTPDLSKVHSVASVFVSRVDTVIDKLLDDKITKERREKDTARLNQLLGRAAVANGRFIFEKFEEIFNGPEFKALAAKGAHPQRVLWASTSTNNSAYQDIKYVTELISRPTVNTLPEKTLMAFLDHGQVKNAFTSSASESRKTIASLQEVGIDLQKVCQDLLDDGVAAFVKAFDELLVSIEKKAAQLSAAGKK